MTTEISKILRLPRKLQRILWKPRKSTALATQNDFRHVIKQVVMSQSAAPATENDMTDSLLGNLLKGEVLQLPRIDTARPQSNQRLETRHVGASKRAFRARLPPIFTLCSFKIDVFLRVFLWSSKIATLKSMFRARLPSIFSTSHKMPRLSRNLHLVATWRSPDNAIRKKHATRHV